MKCVGPTLASNSTRRDAQTIYDRLSDHEFLEKLRGSFFAQMEPTLLSIKS